MQSAVLQEESPLPTLITHHKHALDVSELENGGEVISHTMVWSAAPQESFAYTAI